MSLIVLPPPLKKFFLILLFSTINSGKFILVDQLSKYFIRNFLLGQQGYYFEITSIFDLVYSWNYGVSFGMFSENHAYANYAFIIINSIITLYIWHLAFTARSYRYYQGYCLILGGALGNLADRVIHGAVFDFIYLHIGKWGFPVFNFADSFIFIGVLVVIYVHHKESKEIAKQIAKQKEAEYDANEKMVADMKLAAVLEEEADAIMKLNDAKKQEDSNIKTLETKQNDTQQNDGKA